MPTLAGIVVPFRRDAKSDFANATGADVVRADVDEALKIQAGDLLWDCSRGNRLERLRHVSLPTATMNDLARVYVSETLREALPNVAVRGVTAEKVAAADGTKTKLKLHVGYDIIDPNTGRVLVPGQTTEVVY